LLSGDPQAEKWQHYVVRVAAPGPDAVPPFPPRCGATFAPVMGCPCEQQQHTEIAS
jgi:hypothetical protein